MKPSTGRTTGTEPLVVAPLPPKGTSPHSAPYDGDTKELPGNQRLQPVVHYCARMLRGKLCRLRVVLVEEGKRGKGGVNVNGSFGGPMLTVAPLIPGAQVTPTFIDVPAVPGSEARFSVAPLCRGKLCDARVEFRQGHRFLGAVPLKMKAVGRRLTWFLLFLTIFLPCLLAYVKATAWRPQIVVPEKHPNPRAWLKAQGIDPDAPNENLPLLNQILRGGADRDGVTPRPQNVQPPAGNQAQPEKDKPKDEPPKREEQPPKENKDQPARNEEKKEEKPPGAEVAEAAHRALAVTILNKEVDDQTKDPPPPKDEAKPDDKDSKGTNPTPPAPAGTGRQGGGRRPGGGGQGGQGGPGGPAMPGGGRQGGGPGGPGGGRGGPGGPGGGRPGGGQPGGGAGGMAVPPPPPLVEQVPLMMNPYEGEQAIQKWIQRQTKAVDDKWTANNWVESMNLGDFAMLGVVWLYERTPPEWAVRGVTTISEKITNESPSEDEREAMIQKDAARPIALWLYRGFDLMRLTPCSDLALFAVLALVTLLTWVLSGPASATKRGAAFLVPG